MSRWRRPAAIVLVGMLVATTCVLLGRWQWHRHVVRDAEIATVERNWQAATVPIGTVLPPGGVLRPADQWRTVTLTGRYEASATVLLRGRTVDGHGVFHVLVPFIGPGGTVLVVDRGWVDVGATPDVSAPVPDPPSGTVTLSARLVLAEPSSDRSVPAGQVRSIAIADVLAATGTRVSGQAYDAVGRPVTESPSGEPLGALPDPSLDPGSHLSYAFQWWAFAAMALAGFGSAARRDWLDPQRTAPARRARSRGRDEVDEDALIDAQLAAGQVGPAAPGAPPAADQAKVTRSR
ncbi:MAG: SURF1 family protein [Actinobacteria bacterium]|nr:SURF1 family protein [Actinomycetota bacterium]